MFRPFRDLLWTLRFLTAVPLGRGGEPAPASYAMAAVWFPWVGAAIGFVCAQVVLWTCDVISYPVAVVIGLIASAMLTGGLHLDGLADTADGVFGGWTKERRLEIMRDSRVGSFGVIAIVLVLLLKYTALLTLLDSEVRMVFLPSWVLAVALSRFSMVLSASLAPYARPEGGTGKGFIDRIKPWHAALSAAALLALPALHVVQRGTTIEGAQFLRCLLAILAAVVGLTFYFRGKLGGLTGDTLGAVGECTETLVLVASAACCSKGFTIGA